MMKKKLRSLALFMTFVLLFSSVSFAVSAEPAPAAAPTRVMEVENLRETNAETYLMSDGSYECVVYAYDKYYKAPDNTLQLTSSKIVPAGAAERSGKLSSGKVQYKNAANAFDVHFAGSGAPEVSVAYQGASVTFSPVVPLGTSSRQTTGFAVGKVTACKTLDTLTYTGDNTVTYSNAFPNTDLVYVLENNTLKEYIILNNANASNTFQFSFTLDGVTLESKGTYAEFTDQNGAVLFSLDSLFAVDANGAFTEKLQYTFTPVKDTNTVTVTVTLDEAFLTKASFPVVIDPSVVISSSETEDACVCSLTPNTNYQTAYQLRTGMDNEYGTRRSYIKFNIPSYVQPNHVTRAYLEVEKLSGVDPTIYARRVQDPWSSATITWHNQPDSTLVDASTTSEIYAEGSTWHQMDATAIVQSWVNGTRPNYGFALFDETEDDINHWTTIYSSNAPAPHKPELHVWYTDPDPDPIPFRSIRLYGVNITDHDHPIGYDHYAPLREVRNLWDSKNYTDNVLLTGYFDPETFKDQLKSAAFVTTLSHGYAYVPNGSSTPYATGLLLSEKKDGAQQNIEKSWWLFMNKHYYNAVDATGYDIQTYDRFTYIRNADDFSSLKLAVFVGCETARAADDGSSFAKDIASHGATVTIGFSEEIDCAESCNWVVLFYQEFLSGSTVDEAAQYAADHADNDYTTQSFCIYGDENATLDDLIQLEGT